MTEFGAGRGSDTEGVAARNSRPTLDSGAASVHYQAVIKIGMGDNPIKQTRDIVEGIAYACALLHDEYGWTGGQLLKMLENQASTVEWDYGDT